MEDELALNLAKKYLARFKSRMKIFGTSQDEFLLGDILAPSIKRIDQLIGYDVKDELQFVELVFERGRYAYNDSLEFFEENFQSSILGFSMKCLGDYDD